jgi:hypothetical protein
VLDEYLGLGLTILALMACFIAGVLWPRFRWPALLATALILVAYIAMIMGFGIWAVQCWECYDKVDSDLARRDVFMLVVMLFWIPFAALLLVTWLPAFLGVAWRIWTQREP